MPAVVIAKYTESAAPTDAAVIVAEQLISSPTPAALVTLLARIEEAKIETVLELVVICNPLALGFPFVDDPPIIVPGLFAVQNVKDPDDVNPIPLA